MQGNWTVNQLRFIEWLATPKQERKPETVEQLAEKLGINPATMWRWKKLEGFQDAVNDLARASVHGRLPEVYGALLREAEKGSFQHIKLTLELSGDYVERQKVEHDLSDRTTVSAAAYIEAMNRTRKAIENGDVEG